MKILITGVAGFIGYHTAKHFYDNGFDVVGIDNLSGPNVKIKNQRLSFLSGIEFHKVDITNKKAIEQVFEKHTDFFAIIHLAAQAGVRETFDNPKPYIKTNMLGFQNIIDCVRDYAPTAHFVYASSSSIYGDDQTPKSLYGVTKLSNELVAKIYSETYGFPSTGLRFFTVYGPWIRPDMAMYKFTESILKDEPLTLYNMGENFRDFTYISDAVTAIELAMARDIEDEEFNAVVYDIGSASPISINELVNKLEKSLGRKAKRWLDVPKKGDSINTCAILDEAEDEIGYYPVTTLDSGIKKFIEWYLWYKNEYPLEESQAEN